MNQENLSLKDKDYVDLVVSFRHVSNHIASRLNMERPDDAIREMIGSLIKLNFTHYPNDAEGAYLFRMCVNCLDGGLYELFPDSEVLRTDVFQEMTNMVDATIKSIVPMYGEYKEYDRAFVNVTDLNNDDFALRVEKRIFQHGN